MLHDTTRLDGEAVPALVVHYIAMLKRLIGLAICLVSVLGINFIPLELLLSRNFSSSGAMLLYLAENVTAIAISTAIVFVFGSRKSTTALSLEDKTIESGVRRGPDSVASWTGGKPAAKQAFANFSPLNAQILNFLVPAIIATAATSVFLVLFVFWILKTQMSAPLFWNSVIWIVGFQLIEFTGSVIMIYPLSLRRSQAFLNRTLGRVLLLMLCVLLGVFSAAWINELFVVPFVVLKTLVDIGEQFQIFRDITKTAFALST